jgi:predicted O-methyltransferase YrrM
VRPTHPAQGGAADGRVFPADEVARVLNRLPGPELPWGAGAMLPSGLSIVLDDIVGNDRRRVVELGSGLSTILLARLLAQRHPRRGSRMVAVEHDAGWAEWVTEQLASEGAGRDVVVVHAPLRPNPHASDGTDWYDGDDLAAGLDGVLGADLIDLLLVDGPPAYQAGHGLARYPAVPVLRPRLAPGAAVVLDDVERPGEQEVLRRWERETELAFDRRPEAGVAVARIPAG